METKKKIFQLDEPVEKSTFLNKGTGKRDVNISFCGRVWEYICEGMQFESIPVECFQFVVNSAIELFFYSLLLLTIYYK